MYRKPGVVRNKLGGKGRGILRGERMNIDMIFIVVLVAVN